MENYLGYFVMVDGLDDNSLLWRLHITSYVLRFIIFIMMFWAQLLRDRRKFGSGTTGFYGLSVYSCSNISGMKKIITTRGLVISSTKFTFMY